jgi:adenosine deaminase
MSAAQQLMIRYCVRKIAVFSSCIDMELMVCPHKHTEKGLSYQNVVDIVLETLDAFQHRNPIHIGVVLYVSNSVQRE